MSNDATGQDDNMIEVVDDGHDSTSVRRRPARRGEGCRLRDEIIDAASHLLATTGEIGELSLRAVAREVGIATTSIYLHFRTLNELVLTVTAHYFDEFGLAQNTAAQAAGDSPFARLSARAHAYVQYGMNHPGRYQAMFAAEMVPSQSAPELHHAAVEVFMAVRDEFAAMCPAGEAELLAVHLWTALHGIVALRTARHHFAWPDIDQEIDSLISRLVGVSASP